MFRTRKQSLLGELGCAAGTGGAGTLHADHFLWRAAPAWAAIQGGRLRRRRWPAANYCDLIVVSVTLAP